MRLARMILGALVVVAVCSIASATLDTKVYTLCERNISMNLTSNFRIIPAQGISSPSGMFMQGFTITGTGSKGMALLATKDVYDEPMKFIDPEAFSQLFSSGFLDAVSYSSDSETTDNIIGNWSTLDKIGKNVTVNTMNTKGTALSIYGKSIDTALWNINDSSYAYLLSSLNQECGPVR